MEKLILKIWEEYYIYTIFSIYINANQKFQLIYDEENYMIYTDC